jgi:hypothetical protein
MAQSFEVPSSLNVFSRSDIPASQELRREGEREACCLERLLLRWEWESTTRDPSGWARARFKVDGTPGATVTKESAFAEGDGRARAGAVDRAVRRLARGTQAGAGEQGLVKNGLPRRGVRSVPLGVEEVLQAWRMCSLGAAGVPQEPGVLPRCCVHCRVLGSVFARCGPFCGAPDAARRACAPVCEGWNSWPSCAPTSVDRGMPAEDPR